MDRHQLRLTGGTELSYLTAGRPTEPAVLLLHGFPNSASGFRDLMGPLADAGTYVVAPDLPGFGGSEPLEEPSFPAMGEAVLELLAHLGVGPRYLYVHDFGAPVAFHVAMAEPAAVLGLVIQNANAHRSGFGPGWADTIAYWADPTPENEAKATAHLTLEGTRDQYLAGVPHEVAAAIPAERWEEDFRVMNLPGRMDAQRALMRDYGRYADRFDEIAAYLDRWQPPALLLWGRHDVFFDIAEVLSWLQALPRMEAHVLDGGHLLLETHAAQVAALLRGFIGADGAASRQTARRAGSGHD